MIDDKIKEESTKCGLKLFKKTLSYDEILEGEALVKYKNFKEGKIRLKLQSILLTNFETSDLLNKKKYSREKKPKSSLQKLWVKMTRVFPVSKVKEILKKKKEDEKNEEAKIIIKNLNSVASRSEFRGDRTHSNGFFKRKFVKEGGKNGLVLYEKEFVLTEEKSKNLKKNLLLTSKISEVDSFELEEDVKPDNVNFWDLDPYQKKKKKESREDIELDYESEEYSEEQSKLNIGEKELDDNEVVKLDFRIRLRDRSFVPSYKKNLKKKIEFNLNKTREQVKARIQSKKFKNYIQVPRANMIKEMDSEEDEENSLFEGKKGKMCQVVNKILLKNVDEENRDHSQIYELEDKIITSEKPEEITYKEEISFKKCFRIFKKKYSLKIAIDSNKITSFQKSLNVYLSATKDFTKFFKYIDYTIEEVISIGGDPLETNNLLYANSISLEIENTGKKKHPKEEEFSSDLDIESSIVHSIKLHSFNRKAHVSLDLSNVEVKHYLQFYLSNHVLEKQKFIGKYRIFFVRKRTMVEKQKTEEVFDLFQSWVLEEKKTEKFEIKEINA